VLNSRLFVVEGRECERSAVRSRACPLSRVPRRPKGRVAAGRASRRHGTCARRSAHGCCACVLTEPPKIRPLLYNYAKDRTQRVKLKSVKSDRIGILASSHALASQTKPIKHHAMRCEFFVLPHTHSSQATHLPYFYLQPEMCVIESACPLLPLLQLLRCVVRPSCCSSPAERLKDSP
jgi:hypothetical protein